MVVCLYAAAALLLVACTKSHLADPAGDAGSGEEAACARDTDDDGTPDCRDECPDDPEKTSPGTCGCGKGDEDGDGVPICEDECPEDSAKIAPRTCGCGSPEADADRDGTPDCEDECPDSALKTAPGTCGCDMRDLDTDGDGTPGCNDECEADVNKTEPGVCGCGRPDADADGDGTLNCNDACPGDPEHDTAPCPCDVDTDGDGTVDCNDRCVQDADKTDPGVCGCGVADMDADADGTPDCNDVCPDDPNKTMSPGVCGCGTADRDADGDGVPDCVDLCANDGNKVFPGICGCGTADTDRDGDGAVDCNDECPDDENKLRPGLCGCDAPDRLFCEQTLYAMGENPTSVTTADIDGDGHVDVITANSGSNDIGIRMGRGDGTLGPLETYDMGGSPATVRARDFNQDGAIDVVTGNVTGSFNASVRFGEEDGLSGLKKPQGFPFGNSRDVALGDINGDGVVDLVTGNGDRLGVATGRSDGFTGAGFTMSNPVIRVATADFDADGFVDIAAGLASSRRPTAENGVLVGFSKGEELAAFPPLELHDIFTLPDGEVTPVAAADLDGDGMKDILTANGSAILARLNNGDRTFQEQKESSLGGFAARLETADVDGDGDVDALAPDASSSVRVVLGQGDGTFGEPRVFAVADGESKPTSVAVADLDEDGNMDLISTSDETGEVAVRVGSGGS